MMNMTYHSHSAAKAEPERPSPDQFVVTLEMIRCGVEIYFAFDLEADEPEGLIAEVLYRARDIWRAERSTETH
jgi:hypothetical protein